MQKNGPIWAYLVAISLTSIVLAAGCRAQDAQSDGTVTGSTVKAAGSSVQPSISQRAGEDGVRVVSAGVALPRQPWRGTIGGAHLVNSSGGPVRNLAIELTYLSAAGVPLPPEPPPSPGCMGERCFDWNYRMVSGRVIPPGEFAITFEGPEDARGVEVRIASYVPAADITIADCQAESVELYQARPDRIFMRVKLVSPNGCGKFVEISVLSLDPAGSVTGGFSRYERVSGLRSNGEGVPAVLIGEIPPNYRAFVAPFDSAQDDSTVP